MEWLQHALDDMDKARLEYLQKGDREASDAMSQAIEILTEKARQNGIILIWD